MGKSTAAWEVLRRWRALGVRTGYVDIDQLGMCLPTAPEDPDRTRLKARNLGAVVETFRAAGAQRLLVSGVATAHEAPVFAEHLPGAQITWVLLHLPSAELSSRLRAMGWQQGPIHETTRYAEEVAATSFADISLNVAGQSVADVADRLQEIPVRMEEPPRRSFTLGQPGSHAPIPMLWLCGARASGKSTVGWEVFQRLVGAGVRTLFLDLRQLGFVEPSAAGDPSNHAVRATNLGALLQLSDASAAVVTGAVETEREVRTYIDLLPPGIRPTLVRLQAEPKALRQRFLLRTRRVGWRETGDDLSGMPQRMLERCWREALAADERVDRCGIGDLVVETSGHDPVAIADKVLAAAPGWPDILGAR